MQQLEQEKFGVKVQSHDTIFCLVFLFNMLLSDISTSVGFLYPSDSLRRIVLREQWKKLSRMRIKFKSWTVWTLDHSTSCATDAESLGNQTVNQNVWPHRSHHDYEFKSQWISRYPFIYENEWNHNTKYSYKMQCH